MATTPEKKVKDKVVKILKEHGVYYFFPANKTTALQDREIAAINAAGGTAYVVNEDNVDAVIGFIKIMKGILND